MNSILAPIHISSNLEMGLQSLLLLNNSLVQSVDQLLGGQNQKGTLFSILSSQQTESLIKRFHSSPDISRRFQTLSQVKQDTLKVLSGMPVEKSSQILGPMKGEYKFESNTFKKYKTNDAKEVIICDTRSDVSTECDFEGTIDIAISSYESDGCVKKTKTKKTKPLKKSRKQVTI